MYSGTPYTLRVHQYPQPHPLTTTVRVNKNYLRFSELAFPALPRDVAPDEGTVNAALQHVERDRRQLRENHVVRPRDRLPPGLPLKVVPSGPSAGWGWGGGDAWHGRAVGLASAPCVGCIFEFTVVSAPMLFKP